VFSGCGAIWLFVLASLGLAMNERIAILPSKTPSAEVQIQIIEKKLGAHLKSKHPKLFKKFLSYYRQYTGPEIKEGRKVIRANFLCEVEGDRWRKEWIFVFDGGDCYFNFSFDLEKSEIFDFSINGEG